MEKYLTNSKMKNFSAVLNCTVDQIESTNVLIIGTGPSAITLSFLLSGYWPYYCPNDQDYGPHPNQFLHKRLLHYCAKHNHAQNFKADIQLTLCSLMECDLMNLSKGLTGRITNPIALLMDQLQHPNADIGQYHPSTLKWIFKKECQIDHVVVGSNSLPGGLWQTLAKITSKHNQNNILTLSKRSLMQLPVLEIRDNLEQYGKEMKQALPDNRIPYHVVAEYYQKYVDHFNLSSFFRTQTRIVHLEWNETEKCFIADAIDKQNNCIRFLAKRVVLAKGTSNSPKLLNIFGETLPFVFHSLSKLEQIIKQTQLNFSWKKDLLKKRQIDPILIVGSGLSAADALILLSQRFQNKSMRVIHLFRKSIQDRSLIFNQLISNDNATYPEYYQIFQHMKASVKNTQCLACFSQASLVKTQYSQWFEKYQAYEQCILTSITNKSKKKLATLEFINDQNLKQCSQCNKPIGHKGSIEISSALILIGTNPQLSFISNELQNKLPLNPSIPLDLRYNPLDLDLYTYQCKQIPRLYALGPLAGDYFVRYLQGGALAIANHIWNEQLRDQ